MSLWTGDGGGPIFPAMAKRTLIHKIVQMIPATPGQFAWYYFDPKDDTTMAVPVVSWALCERTYDPPVDGDDDENPDRVVLPLMQEDDQLVLPEYDFLTDHSLGMFQCDLANPETLREAVERKKASNLREKEREAAKEPA